MVNNTHFLPVLSLVDTPMLRPKKFEIEFDAPGAVYFSTQTITGKVVLQVTEPINLKGKLR